MKYNTTYIPKISLKETIMETEYVINEIDKFYRTRYNMTKVITPLFLQEDDEMLLNMPEITRAVTFDISSEYKVGRMLLSSSNWTRDAIDKLNLEDGEGLSSHTSFIWRDHDVNPVSDVTRNELVFQIKLNKEVNIDEIISSETDAVYELTYKLEKELSEKYDFQKQFPKNPDFITAQMMENEYPSLDSKAKEEEFADELNGYILRNPGFKLYSGHFHSNLPPEIYSRNNFNQIVLKDSINSSVLKVTTIAHIANGQLLFDQLGLSNKKSLRELKFYSEQIKNDYNIIEIKINIARLMMALLKKGHISEVQPGVISDESKTISTRYKVEKY